jgi:m7GpppX diphosphatase
VFVTVRAVEPQAATVMADVVRAALQPHSLTVNDRYTNFTVTMAHTTEYAVGMVCRKHHAGRSGGPLAAVVETPRMYADVIVPHMVAKMHSNTLWIDNIVRGVAEQDAVLLRTPEFVVMPDVKWVRPAGSSATHNLYLLVIACAPRLRTVRDLRSGDLPMLERMQAAVAAVLRDHFGGLGMDEVLVTVNHLPAHYRLHVHVVRLTRTAPGRASGDAVCLGRGMFLHNIIDSMRLLASVGIELFERCALTVVLDRRHDLFRLLQAHGQDLQSAAKGDGALPGP